MFRCRSPCTFTSSFTYQATAGTSNGLAHGAAFILQNSTAGAGALGGTGGALGYNGISNTSAAVEFSIYGGSSTNYGAGGATGNYLDTTSGNVHLNNGDSVQVGLSYDGARFLVETLTDLTTSGTWSHTYAVGNLATTVGGGAAYLGFSGGCGGLDSVQTIADFSFNAAPDLSAGHDSRDHGRRLDLRPERRQPGHRLALGPGRGDQ